MKEPITWTTKDGIKLIVDEITDINHLRNIIKVLIKNSEYEEDEMKNQLDWSDYHDSF